ncbi:hypothetical protein LARI1_G008898 [Lachnellula arida]|uniref:Uncharacterized protein n=1 Tax=Lachnellula arida TaxID=1316785 RepID=A0A8T9BAE2_9HELO|nr:hypothetical protein LARI1_G008898 [Lachnellula arida]
MAPNFASLQPLVHKLWIANAIFGGWIDIRYASNEHVWRWSGRNGAGNSVSARRKIASTPQSWQNSPAVVYTTAFGGVARVFDAKESIWSLAKRNLLPMMAPHLAESQHIIIGGMIASKVPPFKAKQIANVAGCSRRTVHGRTPKCRSKASLNPIGRPRSVTPPMLNALCEHLRDNPGLYLEEIVAFLWDKFKVVVMIYSVARALHSINWTKRKIRHIAAGRNADLRGFYTHKTAEFHSDQYNFVDESGSDKRGG